MTTTTISIPLKRRDRIPLSLFPPFPTHSIPFPFPIHFPSKYQTDTCGCMSQTLQKKNRRRRRRRRERGVDVVPPQTFTTHISASPLCTQLSESPRCTASPASGLKNREPSPSTTRQGRRTSAENRPDPPSPPVHHLLLLLLNKLPRHIPRRPVSLLRDPFSEATSTILAPWRMGKVADRNREVTFPSVLHAWFVSAVLVQEIPQVGTSARAGIGRRRTSWLAGGWGAGVL